MLKKIKFKYSKKLISNNLTYKLSIIINLGLMIFSLLLIILYIIGNFQQFQDQTQKILLGILSYISIFNIFFSVLLVVESIFKLFLENRKLKTTVNLIYLIITIIFEMFCLEFSTIVSYLSKGLTGN